MSSIAHGRVILRDNYEPAQLFIDGYQIAAYDLDGSEAMRETALHLLNLTLYVRPEFVESLKVISKALTEWASRLEVPA